MWQTYLLVLTSLLLLWQGDVVAKSPSALSSDKQKVKNWNQFASDLYNLHKSQVTDRSIRTETQVGGYATHLAFYEETRYYDAKSGVLLSRIQRERSNSELIHLIEIFIYDEKNRIQRDYLAVYLPEFRNAPIQTLINLHAHHDGLHAFRQFDASGDRIYEQCKGNYNGIPVLISLDEDQFSPGYYQQTSVLNSQVYQHCFATIAEVVDTNVVKHSNSSPGLMKVLERNYDLAQVESKITAYDRLLAKEPDNVVALIERGHLYFVMHEFDLAIMDYSGALRIDNSQHDARFGRGMALARNGQIKDGISDLKVYIQHHPASSVAYTKRGVRYLWLGEDALAEADFVRALQLDPDNAEAHDDLGVILARRGDYSQAVAHFQQTVSLDPSYVKGHHNLAMVYHLIGKETQALDAINHALKLSPQARDSLLLKAEILERFGGVDEASRLRQDAEFLPEGNWSERLSVQ